MVGSIFYPGALGASFDNRFLIPLHLVYQARAHTSKHLGFILHVPNTIETQPDLLIEDRDLCFKLITAIPPTTIRICFVTSTQQHQARE
jgi:hypothetical protein